MFPRRSRLTRADFDSPAVIRGKRLSSTHLSLVVPSGEVCGYSVVISKKTARLSVTRHRLKRRVLALLRGLTLPPALVVFPKASASDLSPGDLKTELVGLLSKITPRP